MDNIEIEKAMSEALWAAHSLFDRGKTSGSSANMSFMYASSSRSFMIIW